MVPEMGEISDQHLQVIEVETMEEKHAAYQLHLSKSTFHEERGLVQFRIFSGDVCNCRSWLLRHPRSPAEPSTPHEECPRGEVNSDMSNGNRGGKLRRRGRGRGRPTAIAATPTTLATYLAAVTVRVNTYQKRQGRWGQILNMSTRRERHGFGTFLIAGLEELLRREDVDVLVLYPAENGRAPAFWGSIGFGAHKVSLLPDEELVSHEQGGPLLPEFDPGSLSALPRWEKRIISNSGSGNLELADTTAQDQETGYTLRFGKRQRGGRGGNRVSVLPPFRAVLPSASRLSGEPLMAATKALQDKRARLKAHFMAGPLEGAGVPDVVWRGALLAASGASQA